mmetsp:Transcript_11069/g.15545  ORF Transcript_11069/g.15545 Transcript_11069/m.15545 type:complete len:120 (-) Transcript_11069:374-733(-)
MLRLRTILFVCVSLLVSLQDSVSAQHYATTTTSRSSDDDLTNAALLAMTAVPSILMQHQVQATTTTSTFGVPAKVLDTLNVAVNTAVSVALAGALFCEFRSSSPSVSTANGIKKRGWRL